MTQFKKGDKVQLKKDFDYRESFINLYTAGPWVVRNVDRFGYLDLGKTTGLHSYNTQRIHR